jgi:hypothetical protein
MPRRGFLFFNTRADGAITPPSRTITSNYSTQGYKNIDYDVSLGAQTAFTIVAGTYLVIDSRFDFGLTSVNSLPSATSPAQSWKYQDLQLLIGLQFGTYK